VNVPFGHDGYSVAKKLAIQFAVVCFKWEYNMGFDCFKWL